MRILGVLLVTSNFITGALLICVNSVLHHCTYAAFKCLSEVTGAHEANYTAWMALHDSHTTELSEDYSSRAGSKACMAYFII